MLLMIKKLRNTFLNNLVSNKLVTKHKSQGIKLIAEDYNEILSNFDRLYKAHINTKT